MAVDVDCRRLWDGCNGGRVDRASICFLPCNSLPADWMRARRRRRRLRVAVAGRTVERLSTPSRAKGEAGLAAYHGVRQRADSVRLRLGLKRMLRLWIGEESGAKRGSRVVGTSQSGRFLDPSDSATGYPATFSMHLVGLDGAGSWFKVFRSYHSVAPD